MTSPQRDAGLRIPALCCCRCVVLVGAELPYSQTGRTARLIRRGRGDQRSPGGFVTLPSVNSGPAKRDCEVLRDQASAPVRSLPPKHPDRTPVRLSARREVGAGWRGLGGPRFPAPTSMPVPKAYCHPNLTGNALRAKDDWAGSDVSTHRLQLVAVVPGRDLT